MFVRPALGVCAAVLSLAGCHRDTSIAVYHWDTKLAPVPARVGAETVSLRLTDKSEKPVAGAHIELEGNMTHAGMEPVVATASDLGEGRYQGTLRFNMPGDWAILIHARLADGHKLEEQISVRDVQPN